jgi:hypothetical protein
MAQWHGWMAMIWTALGILWLKRAYLGRKEALLVTLRHPSGQPERKRARLAHALLGAASLFIGVAHLVLLLKLNLSR